MDEPAETNSDAEAEAPQKPRRATRRLLICLVAFAFVYGVYARLHGLTRPAGQDTGLYGLIARNHLKYGFVDGGLAQIASPGPVLPPHERVYYDNHPPLVPILSAAGIAALGPSVLAIRLPHLIIELVSIAALAWLAGALFGRAAALWCAVVAAVVPIASRFSFALPDPLGSALVLCVTLASLFYYRYAQTGRWRYFIALAVVTVIGLLTDWPAYVPCFAFVGHAVFYHSKAKRWALLLLLVPVFLVAGILISHGTAIPAEQHLYGGLHFAFSKWAALEQVSYSPVQWLRVFASQHVEHFSPLVALALVWALCRVPRDAVTRANRPGQHLLLLWLWPAAYTVVFHRTFYEHHHYYLLYLPAVTVTLGAIGGWLYCGAVKRLRAVRAIVATAACVLLVLWSHYIVAVRPDPLAAEREQSMQWAQDIARRSTLDEENAFVGHYAMQMRLVADRIVHERVDTERKLRTLMAAREGRVKRLFVPRSHPFATAGFGRLLLSRFDVRYAHKTLVFALASEAKEGPMNVRALGPIPLDGGVMVERLEFAIFQPTNGGDFLYLAPVVAQLPTMAAGDQLVWHLRFVHAEGAVTEATAPAQASASYCFAAPSNWSPHTGRIELRLRHDSSDVWSADLATRLERLALRIVTLGRLGLPRCTTRYFLTKDGAPIVLHAGEQKPPESAAPPPAGAPPPQATGSAKGRRTPAKEN